VTDYFRRSPNLTPPDFFLCGLLKGSVYSNKPRTIDALKDVMRQEVAAITDVTLLNVFTNLQTRIEKCLDTGGGYFQHALGRPCFATYKVSTCQFSQEPIQKLKRYWVS
jgi:hypothetical protein